MNKVIDFTEDDCDKIGKMYMDLYIGKDLDNLSITARVHNLEQRFKSQDKLFWMVLGTCLLVIGDIIFKH